MCAWLVNSRERERERERELNTLGDIFKRRNNKDTKRKREIESRLGH